MRSSVPRASSGDQEVRGDYRPGRFLLTGSANVMTSPRVSDSLAGRIETLRVLPLMRAEIESTEPTFLDRVFAGKLLGAGQASVGDELVRTVLAGGFPEALAWTSERRRQTWARSWLASVLTRDLRDIAEIGKLTELPKFIRLLAEHSGKLVNYSRFGSGIGVSHKTGQRYVSLLEQVFVVATLQPWHTNALKRIEDALAAFPRLRSACRSVRLDRGQAEGGPQRTRQPPRELRVLGNPETDDGIGSAIGALPFPGPADARSGHRSGAR